MINSLLTLVHTNTKPSFFHTSRLFAIEIGVYRCEEAEVKIGYSEFAAKKC